ncbi:MAG: hypothetical protein GSR84_00805 [Desulfurococcales archaeon]|nr:hypothetical protein [Desulfurococcales archaeon]
MGQGVVVKISGSLLDSMEPGYYSKLVGALLSLASRGPLAVVTGGGAPARRGVRLLQELGATRGLQDLAGIWASRLHAITLSLALYPRSPPRVLVTLEEVLEVLAQGLIPVTGGFQPGQSTNAVAAAIAEAMGAGLLVNMLHGVEGVYEDKPGGRLARRLCYSDLRRIIARFSQEPGGYKLFDRVALDIVERSHVRVVFIDGSDPSRLPRVVDEPGSMGSLVGPCHS